MALYWTLLLFFPPAYIHKGSHATQQQQLFIVWTQNKISLLKCIVFSPTQTPRILHTISLWNKFAIFCIYNLSCFFKYIKRRKIYLSDFAFKFHMIYLKKSNLYANRLFCHERTSCEGKSKLWQKCRRRVLCIFTVNYSSSYSIHVHTFYMTFLG